MDHLEQKSQCVKKWWILSAIGGLVFALLLLWLAGSGLPGAIIAGILVAVIAGLILSKVQCPDQSVPTSAPAAKPAEAQPVTAPTPASAASVAPAAVASTVPTAAPAAAKKPAAKKAPAKKAAPKASAAKPATAKAPARKPVAADGKPEMLTAARGGVADDLKLLKGVGPKLEQTLNALGVYHFDQVASWRKKEIEWVDDKLKFKGRIERDDWIKQAKVLAKGGETEFSKRSKKT